jgi:hypothetical protein
MGLENTDHYKDEFDGAMKKSNSADFLYQFLYETQFKYGT